MLYRNKPQLYWDHIAHNRCGLMEVYLKDNNGHSACPINGVLEGLFFNGKHRNGLIPGRSPFGEIRMEVPVWRLFTPAHKLYFADFYCNSAMHYVTILLTRDGSRADKFARKFLIPLSARANPFFKIRVLSLFSPHSESETSAELGLWSGGHSPGLPHQRLPSCLGGDLLHGQHSAHLCRP